MINNELAKRLSGQAELFLRKNGPAILTAVGVGGFIASNVLIARAALKVEEPLKEIKLKLARVKETEGQEEKDLRVEIGRDFFEIVKIFAPAITVGSVSIVCVVTAHGMMQKRQASLIAAYTALDRGFKAYRARVAEELGAEKEKELYGRPELLPCEIEGEDPRIDYTGILPSPYARFFDEMNPNWEKNPEYNLFFLKLQEQWANDRLKARGFLFLNEVYDSLGMRWSQSGQYVGWKLNNGGDNHVDFGLSDVHDDVTRAFVNGLDNVVLLDFNVDGPIGI